MIFRWFLWFLDICSGFVPYWYLFGHENHDPTELSISKAILGVLETKILLPSNSFDRIYQPQATIVQNEDIPGHDFFVSPFSKSQINHCHRKRFPTVFHRLFSSSTPFFGPPHTAGQGSFQAWLDLVFDGIGDTSARRFAAKAKALERRLFEQFFLYKTLLEANLSITNIGRSTFLFLVMCMREIEQGTLFKEMLSNPKCRSLD